MAQIEYIPVRQLRPSEKNVRKAAGDKQSFKELKASIQTQGILQNLVVAPVADEPDTYEIHAGSRRHRAVTELIQEGKVDASLAPDYLVPCLVEDDPEKLAAVSLAENLCREGMHEVDEFEAFSNLAVEHGYTIAQIASTFGKSQKYVRQVLALGACAPELLEYCRQGKLGTSALRAFTLVKDHEKQLQAYKHVQAQSHGHVGEYFVRQYLTNGKMQSDHQLVKFVGPNDYQKAGGTFDRDLFNDESYVNDTALLKKLASEKAEQLKAEAGEGWAFVDVDFDADGFELRRKPRMRGKPGPETENLKAEVVATRAQFEELDNRCDEFFMSDEDNDDEYEKLAEQRDEAEEKIDRLQAELEASYDFDDNSKAQSGVIITIGRNGEPEFYTGILTDEQAREVAKAGDADNVTNLDSANQGKDKPKYSPALVQDLNTYKTEAARLALVMNPDVAIELAHFELTVRALQSGGYGKTSISYSNTEADTARGDIAGNLARVERRREFDDLMRRIPKDWLDMISCAQHAEAFEEYCSWNHDLKSQALAHAVSLSLSCDNEFTGHLLNITGVELKTYWRPTVDNFFSRINHQTCLECAADIMGETWAEEHANLKKKDLAIRLEEQCEADQPGCWWIPDPMLTAAADNAGPDDDEEQDAAEEDDEPLAAAAG